MAAIKQDLLASISESASSEAQKWIILSKVGPRGKPSYQAPEMHEQGSYETWPILEQLMEESD